MTSIQPLERVLINTGFVLKGSAGLVPLSYLLNI